MNAFILWQNEGGQNPERVMRDRRHPMEFSNVEIKRLFRFERPNLNRLIDRLAVHLEHPTRRNHSVPTSVQVCIGLHYLATASFQSTVAQVLGVSQSTTSRCYFNFTNSVLQEFGYLIAMGNLDDIGHQFVNVCDLPQVCGAIDCTHIEIIKPQANNYPDEYLNRKGWHSLNVQAICDTNGVFLDVCAEWPGSVHDSRIFRNSEIHTQFMNGRFQPTYLLGDGGYAVTPFLMTPYRNPGTEAQRRFNNHLSRGRVSIEMAFGRLKRRFACLYRIFQIPLERTGRVIMACFVLHNLCIVMNDPDFENVDVEGIREQPVVIDADEQFDNNNLNQDGNRRRDQLARIFE